MDGQSVLLCLTMPWIGKQWMARVSYCASQCPGQGSSGWTECPTVPHNALDREAVDSQSVLLCLTMPWTGKQWMARVSYCASQCPGQGSSGWPECPTVPHNALDREAVDGQSVLLCLTMPWIGKQWMARVSYCASQCPG